MNIPGLSPDAPVEVDPRTGGMQSATPYAFELLPPSSLFAAAAVARKGAEKYGETFDSRNYTRICSRDHLNHAIAHIYAYLAGDASDDHLAHAIVRLLFAFDCVRREEEENG